MYIGIVINALDRLCNARLDMHVCSAGFVASAQYKIFIDVHVYMYRHQRARLYIHIYINVYKYFILCTRHKPGRTDVHV